MLEQNLIKKCICNNRDNFLFKVINDIEVAECLTCGVIHQKLENFSYLDLNEFYKNQFHFQYQKQKGVITYQDRYEHDRKISKLRLSQYKDYLQKGMHGLDVGSSNSAFVHESKEQGINCLGLEPGENISDPEVTIKESLETLAINENTYDFVTIHDTVEHMIDPYFSLKKVYNLLKPTGIVIIDLPHFFVEEGKHHWKKIEHLWFFNQTQFVNLLQELNFLIEKIDTPIPGKIVFYARKK